MTTLFAIEIAEVITLNRTSTLLVEGLTYELANEQVLKRYHQDLTQDDSGISWTEQPRNVEVFTRPFPESMRTQRMLDLLQKLMADPEAFDLGDELSELVTMHQLKKAEVGRFMRLQDET